MSARTSLVFIASFVAALVAAPSSLVAQQATGSSSDSLDVLIVHGTVVDGSGNAPRRADVGVRGDRIVFVGDASRMHVPARRTIDASGRFVAPGFIDPHTHLDRDLARPATRENVGYLTQGVTTVVIGNDGYGPVHVGQELDKLQQGGIGTNVAGFTGFGTIRGNVLHMSGAAPTDAQLATERAMVDTAMREGALGISTGLFYPPQSFAATPEVIELSKVAAKYGGIYDTHLRDESSYTVGLIGAIDEALRIGREAHIPIHVSHIKALGVDVWGKSDSVIKLVEAAHRDGMTVTANQYPYTASGTSFSASLLPRWAVQGGHDSLEARIANPAEHARLITDMRDNLRRRGGAKSLLVTGARDTTLVGKTLADIAAERHGDPTEVALDVIQHGGADVASFNMTDADIANFMRQPWVVTGSDGSDGMPRKFGTFPRKLHEYVFTKHVISLPFAVRNSSARTAEILHLPQRGLLQAGYYADVIVFDSTITDHATYEKPTLLSTGVEYVLVNGKLAIDAGKPNGVLAGRALKRGQ
jgi:N-acyl-D-aspartate/D-glutamate deacylase